MDTDSSGSFLLRLASFPLRHSSGLRFPSASVEFRVVYKGRPLHACPEGGIGPFLGVSPFPVDKAADCAYMCRPQTLSKTSYI